MKSFKSILTIFFLIFYTILNVQSQVYLTNEGKVTFVSDAPLELISASSNNVRGAVNVTDNRFLFIIDNKSFLGFNSPLQQEHFYENYIETEKYESSTFQGKIIEDINMDQTGVQEIRAKGILSIHGIEKERIINATLEYLDGTLILKCDFKVSLEEHNIRIPNVVYQKLAEIIEVSVQAKLEKKID